MRCMPVLKTVVFMLLGNIAHAQIPSNFNLFASNRPPSEYALEIFDEVKSALETQDVELHANLYVPNAMATTMRGEYLGTNRWGNPIWNIRKVVLYNPNFMTHLELSSGSEWAAISIIAHEIGHHLAGHTMPQYPWESMQHPWARELEADYYSGKCLAELGAEPEDLQRAQRLMFSRWGNASHPDSIRRIQAINRGWMATGRGSIEADLKDIWAEIQDDLTRWWH